MLIGEDCQDKKYVGECIELIVGDNNIFCEGVIVYCGIVQDEGIICIGLNNLLMVNVYVVYDCVIGDNIILVNNVVVVGYVEIGDYVILGGIIVVYQFCKIGVYVFIGGGVIIL